jgi:tRNA G10  N-methylase Trm11
MKERLSLMDLGDDITSPDLKRQRLALADESLNTVRFIGDAAVAAFFSADKDRAREEKREELAQRIANYLGQGDVSQRPTEEVKALNSGKFAVTTFHWEIEFPEVFLRENSGFDGIVGNPPFAGVVTLSASSHQNYTDFLRQNAPGAGGKADLVAFFFRRAYSLLRREASLGLISTKTIRQGDSRKSSLEPILMVENGCIYDATRRLTWPGQAAVVVSVVHILKGEVISPANLDGTPVQRISAYLLQ